MSGLSIGVFGSGAVGGYFGGRLAEAGEEVRFVTRGQHFAAIRERGLRVSSVHGDFVVPGARFTDAPASIGHVDVVLVGVKAWQVPEAAEAIRPMVGERTAIVPLQNGVEAADQLAGVHGAPRVLGGYCRILAFLDGPGHIRHTGVTPFISFGELDGSSSARVEALGQAFARTRGITVEVPSDIRAAMWSKFLFIAALSGVGAVTRAPIGVIRSQPEIRRMLEDALEEIYAVAAASGVALAGDTVAKTLAWIDGLPWDGTASMQRDILQGRPSELEAQVGAVVRLGERAGVAVPIHRMIYAALVAQERKARGELQYSI